MIASGVALTRIGDHGAGDQVGTASTTGPASGGGATSGGGAEASGPAGGVGQPGPAAEPGSGGQSAAAGGGQLAAPATASGRSAYRRAGVGAPSGVATGTATTSGPAQPPPASAASPAPSGPSGATPPNGSGGSGGGSPPSPERQPAQPLLAVSISAGQGANGGVVGASLDGRPDADVTVGTTPVIGDAPPSQGTGIAIGGRLLQPPPSLPAPSG